MKKKILRFIIWFPVLGLLLSWLDKALKFEIFYPVLDELDETAGSSLLFILVHVVGTIALFEIL